MFPSIKFKNQNCRQLFDSTVQPIYLIQLNLNNKSSNNKKCSAYLIANPTPYHIYICDTASPTSYSQISSKPSPPEIR